ncbi:MAG: hypothetical protein OHK0029_07130 [Armatimonadaceae bacterium]
MVGAGVLTTGFAAGLVACATLGLGADFEAADRVDVGLLAVLAVLAVRVVRDDDFVLLDRATEVFDEERDEEREEREEREEEAVRVGSSFTGWLDFFTKSLRTQPSLPDVVRTFTQPFLRPTTRARSPLSSKPLLLLSSSGALRRCAVSTRT